MFIVIVTLFAVCWFPYHGYFVYQYIDSGKELPKKKPWTYWSEHTLVWIRRSEFLPIRPARLLGLLLAGHEQRYDKSARLLLHESEVSLLLSYPIWFFVLYMLCFGCFLNIQIQGILSVGYLSMSLVSLFRFSAAAVRCHHRFCGRPHNGSTEPVPPVEWKRKRHNDQSGRSSLR